MTKIYGINFKENGKVYYFSAGENFDLNKGDNVVVSTEKGLQFGKIVADIQDHDIKLNELKEIIRKSNADDYAQYLKNQKDATQALKNARKIAEELNLGMVIIDAAFTFDKKQLLFHFSADGRIDFRELAKKLAGIYRTRIELRQIGARDKAKEVGGHGQCGRRLCCGILHGKMESVTMNMAKNQMLVLNPSRINGQCGRLLCCLTYENDEYTRCQKGMPNVGAKVKTKSGIGNVISIDILSRKYVVNVDGEKITVELEEKHCNR